MKRVLHLTVLVLLLASLFAIAGPAPSLAGGQTRVLVEFAPGSGPAVRGALQRAGGTVHYDFDTLNTIAVSLPEAALAGIQRNPNVVSVEEDAPRYLLGQTTPWGIDRVQAPAVWDPDGNGTIDTGAVAGGGITICIIDSGLYTGHEDMQGVNVIGGTPTGWNSDLCGHGTHVAGTIAAQNNALGVVGVSPEVSLYIVKVFGDDCGWSYASDLVNATTQCEAAGADIISMSLGGSRSVRAELNQFAALYGRGILSIAAAGNDGTTRMSYPASYSSVVSVAATDVNNLVADFSQKNSQVELAAPGVSVLSTVPFVGASVSVDGVTYMASGIEFAKTGTGTGALVDGGLCTATGAWSGKVVLCERGTVDFYTKVHNVQLSGGTAAIIYNNVPGGFAGTLGDGNTSTIPAVSISQEDGTYLVANKLGSSATVNNPAPTEGSGYEAWDGTSMATPHVSGVAALLWSLNPTTLTNTDIRTAMTATALDLGAAGRDDAYGYGLVQAYDALVALGGGGTTNQPPTASFTATCTDLTCSFNASASSDSDGTITSYAWTFGDGATGSTATASHTYAADGTYNVTLTVTDDDSATGSQSQSVSVSSGSVSETTIFVSDITMSKKVAGTNRSALATITIKDTDGNLVSGATVHGTWSGAVSGTVSGVTGTNGTVTFESIKIRTSGTATFTVTNVVKTGSVYDSGLNAVTSADIPL